MNKLMLIKLLSAVVFGFCLCALCVPAYLKRKAIQSVSVFMDASADALQKQEKWNGREKMFLEMAAVLSEIFCDSLGITVNVRVVPITGDEEES